MWNNYYKQLRSIGMPTFKVARKTFMTTSTLLDIPQSIGRTMLGQKTLQFPHIITILTTQDCL